ncbi:MAG TPA: DUF4194 domain-containing protein [Chroococcales cyanobacterium]
MKEKKENIEKIENIDLPSILIRLLKGVLYREEHPKLWQDLLRLQGAAADYLGVIDLDLTLDEPEGYAFLRQRRHDAAEEAPPRLIASRPLGYPVSLLCVLLRKKQVEADAGGATTRVILTRSQIVEMMQIFLPSQSNEARIVEQIDAHLSKVTELGFLKKLKGSEEAYEVRSILKAAVDADWLANFEENLRTYQDYAAGNA